MQIEKLDKIMYLGYLSITGPWSECRISSEDNLFLTPLGEADVQLLH